MKITKTQLKQIIKEELSEVYSEKQRRWACAQTGDNFKGERSLTKKEAEEMCKGPMKKESLRKEDGHSDVPSARRKLKTTIEDAAQILQGLEQMEHEGELPSWWMGKITLAADYLNKARDYILVSGD